MCKETKQVANSLHRVRECGCGNRFATVEMPYVKKKTARQREALKRIALVQKATGLPEWGRKAGEDVMAGMGWKEAAKRQGRSEMALRLLFAQGEEREKLERRVAAENRRRAEDKKKRWREMTPEQRRERRALESARSHARAEAKERGVDYVEVYREWGLLEN